MRFMASVGRMRRRLGLGVKQVGVGSVRGLGRVRLVGKVRLVGRVRLCVWRVREGRVVAEVVGRMRGKKRAKK